MKRRIRLTEGSLKRMIKESVRQVINEGVDPTSKVLSLIQQANDAYNEAVEEQGNDEYPLMDKDGTTYGLSGEITLNNRGYVVIPFVNGWGDYNETVKVRVLRKVNGKIVLIKGDYFEEGWLDVQKMLKQIIKDAKIGTGYFKNYNADWEDAESDEDFKAKRSALKDMNKQIGRKANVGMEYINKR